MARVTVEDCVVRVPNRFKLVMLAAQRARNLGAGSPPTVDRDNDKNPVVALREIAESTVDLKELEQGLIRGLQRVVESEEPDTDDLEALALQLAAETGTARDEDEIAEDVLTVEEEEADEGEAEPDDLDITDDVAMPDEDEGADRL